MIEAIKRQCVKSQNETSRLDEVVVEKVRECEEQQNS